MRRRMLGAGRSTATDRRPRGRPHHKILMMALAAAPAAAQDGVRAELAADVAAGSAAESAADFAAADSSDSATRLQVIAGLATYGSYSYLAVENLSGLDHPGGHYIRPSIPHRAIPTLMYAIAGVIRLDDRVALVPEIRWLDDQESQERSMLITFGVALR